MKNDAYGIGARQPPFIDLSTYVPQIEWKRDAAFNGKSAQKTAEAQEQQRYSPLIDPNPVASADKRQRIRKGGI